jgi:hypothetical protein
MAAPSVTDKRCPNCDQIVPSGRTRCSKCSLEVSKMADFAAAKKAALKKGLRTEVEAGPPAAWRDPRLIRLAAVVIVVGGLIGGLVLHFANRQQPWELYPTSRVEAVEKLMMQIAADSDKSLGVAFNLVGAEIRAGHGEGFQDHYRQTFHEVNKYLSGEFGSDWPTTMKVEPDKTNTDIMLVKVGPETLHVTTLIETPADKRTEANRHYSIGEIQEFDVNAVSRTQQMAAIGGYLKGVYGAAGSANQLEQVAGAGGNTDRERPMETKLRILPLLRNPRGESVKMMAYQAWVVRKDPVVRARLAKIVADERYAGDIRDVAKAVLENRVSEEELISAHINRTD